MPKITDLETKPKRIKFLDLISANENNNQPRPIKISVEKNQTSNIDLNDGKNVPNDKIIDTIENTQQGYKKGTNKGTQGYAQGYKQEYSNGTNKGTVEHTKGYNQEHTRVQQGYGDGTAKGTNRSTGKGTNKSTTKYNLSENIVGISPNQVYALSGIKGKIVHFIVELCLMHGTTKTLPLSTSEIANLLNEKTNSIKVAISRLKKENFLTVVESRRGLYACYEIPELVRQYILDKKWVLNNTKNILNKGTSNNTNNSTHNNTNNGTTRDVSSSNYNNTTTIPDAFKKIDYSPLSRFGFDESHIIQIYREYAKNPDLSLSIDIIQNSIYALAFDLKHNNVAEGFKNSPTVVLTALLKKGQPYSSKTPHKVLSPREEAMQEYVAAQEKRQHTIQELENKTKEFELQEWLKSLSEQEVATFMSQDPCPAGMPEKIFQTSRRKKALAAAQEYFLTMIWPQKSNQIETIEPRSKPKI